MRITEFITEAANPSQQAAIAKKKKKGMAEGLPQILRKVVPGYARREIDRKMDAEKFGRTDVDRDANYWRYKKIQDKLKEQGVAEGRFQDEYPEYGGKDKNKAMTYDRNAGMGYEGEPWSDSNSNWSGDNPNYADSTYEPEPVILRGPDGKQKAFSPDSPEVQGVYDREYGIQNKLGQITKAFQKGIDFNDNRPKPYTNLATSDSTNDFSDPIKLGQYDVDFPEQTVDKFDVQRGQSTQQIIPSPNDPNAPFQKPVKAKVPAADAPKPDNATVPIKQPVAQTDQKSAKQMPPKAVPIPTKPRPGSWQELAKLNNITDPRKLQAGTYIKTPDGESVYVNKGDTLSRLAQRMRPTGVKENITHQLAQEFEMFLESNIEEDWNKVNKKDKTSGMSQKAVNAYRRENPGSKLKTAVTTKPSKLKPGSKAAKRRKSFCARMGGNKGPMKKPNGKPTPKALALRRWNCESIEELQELLMLAEQFVNKKKNESI